MHPAATGAPGGAGLVTRPAASLPGQGRGHVVVDMTRPDHIADFERHRIQATEYHRHASELFLANNSLFDVMTKAHAQS